ncbi:uroporphyrinogen-III C-methyltransferase [Citrobacter amalonaticus]|uniref:uroporphyrinogen-III C-methyltransferase n=1 Tax=Citrobacter amalonaticus TaxID=35703 RepID=A0A2S4RZQ0_CITAM|nr:uroporphyrinogen-III C-methyltransferase [Citrobacter amalonaticus]POT58128.1 uroporphyrinogen-III C-methyltransferase [Citrobacter amalonaticus]POT76347.1 uroporphyrinogen-III C-methyltransferase [Citrobacter amalonaticus]POU66654.1 uroporphyrinogen-III C-methyltransferase [Citrobacter amalonaticus]POV05582.1 uroporphyrinogen-III C-methyltransferase [Citrobacter amalonaticus]
MKTSGKVWLVGAGPGDISLLTLKAQHCIHQADVIIYDRLVNPKILEWAAKDCTLINVGKNPGNHCVPQHEINALLLHHARTHHNIVRLKGGDPYVFGRGAEEVECLVEERIPFEVVPGISSAIGGLACAGIPVTHRDLASGFHVVTGHTREGNQQQDWRQLARLHGTLVIVMGIANLPFICEELLMGGKSPNTPAAIVMSATRENQRRLTCTLGTLLSKAQEANIAPPALIVVGEVVSLSDRLSFIPEVTQTRYCESCS